MPFQPATTFLLVNNTDSAVLITALPHMSLSGIEAKPHAVKCGYGMASTKGVTQPLAIVHPLTLSDTTGHLDTVAVTQPFQQDAEKGWRLTLNGRNSLTVESLDAPCGQWSAPPH